MSALLLSKLIPKNDNLDVGISSELASLPAFLRVLLTTDGTVTKSLEAFFWEFVRVDVIQNDISVLDTAVSTIDRDAGSKVLTRKIELRGDHSGNLYAKADSLICLELLPEKIRHDLNIQKLGIGEILRECGLETYREVLTIGREYDEQQDWVWRTYRIMIDHKPVILITEHFPLSIFQQ